MHHYATRMIYLPPKISDFGFFFHTKYSKKNFCLSDELLVVITEFKTVTETQLATVNHRPMFITHAPRFQNKYIFGFIIFLLKLRFC